MKITTLGTNGWFSNKNGETVCTLVQTKEWNIILDAGSGITKIKHLIDFAKPTYIFLSHMHLDHTYGLHTLDYYTFEKPLRIIVPIGEKENFDNQWRAPYAKAMDKQAFPIEVIEAENINEAGLPFKVSVLPLVHAVPDTGYRLELEGKSIAYLLDTGYCENAVTLAKNADVVITECGSLPGHAVPGWPHMDPPFAARLAKEANAKQMILIHFGPADYLTIEQRKTAVDSYRDIYPNMITAVDDMEIFC